MDGKETTTSVATTASNTATADTSDFSTSGSLDGLLSGDGEPIGIVPADEPGGVATETPAETENPSDTETEDTPTETTEDVNTDTETQEDEPAEETDFALEESDRDYSQAAYERAAKAFGKKYGKDFDLANNSDRALLRDLMEQREQAKETRTAEATEETEAAETAERERKDKEAKEAEAARTLTPEKMLERLNMTYKWAETRIVPQVAQDFASKFLTTLSRAMWPDRQIADIKLTPEQASPVVQMLLTGVAMSISEVLPAIEKSIPNAVRAQYPHLDRIHNMGVRAAALEQLGEARDQKGNLAYPDLETLVDSGAIKRAMKSIPGFDKMHFDNDPVKDFAERVKLAYRVARGSRPDPAALRKASERGAQNQRKAEMRQRSGRLAPGASKGTFGAPPKDAASKLMEGLAGMDGDAFGAAVARDTAKK